MAIDVIAKKPLISVIMPHWKALPYVGETVESIVSQDFVNGGGQLELIVIDDGSPAADYDTLTEIVLTRTMNGDRLTNFHIETVPHRGKNRVLEAAKKYVDSKSKYVCVMDSDDVFAPSFLSTLYQRLEQERVSKPNVVMAYCDSLLIDEAGFCMGTGTAPDFDRELYVKGRNDELPSNFIPGNALVVAERFLNGVPIDLDASNRDKWYRHMGELGYDGIAIRVLSQDQPNEVREYFYRQVRASLSGHGAKLDDEGFLLRWPQGVPNPHWREWLRMSKDEKKRLLSSMPDASTRTWDKYRSA